MLEYILLADMAELADALDSGSSRGFSVQVQVLLSALKKGVSIFFTIDTPFQFVGSIILRISFIYKDF